jgi:hypothetical protein
MYSPLLPVVAEVEARSGRVEGHSLAAHQTEEGQDRVASLASDMAGPRRFEAEAACPADSRLRRAPTVHSRSTPRARRWRWCP